MQRRWARSALTSGRVARGGLGLAFDARLCGRRELCAATACTQHELFGYSRAVTVLIYLTSLEHERDGGGTNFMYVNATTPQGDAAVPSCDQSGTTVSPSEGDGLLCAAQVESNRPVCTCPVLTQPSNTAQSPCGIGARHRPPTPRPPTPRSAISGQSPSFILDPLAVQVLQHSCRRARFRRESRAR